MDNPGIGDNHNASVFHWCYKRMGEFIPQLVDEGKQPRVMLEYSGTLLHGLRQMGLNDVFDNLKRITCDPRYRRAVEWLGCPWGHAVAPSTPAQDFRLHVLAWQHHFAAIFGLEALGRVRGFSPPKWPCPTTRTWPTSSSRPSRTAATSGCWSRSTPSSVPRTATGRNASTCRTGSSAATRAARRPPSSPSSRPRAATPSWSPKCSLTTRPKGFRAGNWPANRSRRW